MTTDHQRRAAVMYPAQAAKAEPVRAAPTNGRAAAGAILYGSSKPGQVGSIDNALHSSFDPIEARVRDDKERLAQTQNTREKVRGLATRGNVTPSDLHTLLSPYREARTFPRSEEAIVKRWEGSDGFDRVRREAGSTEAAMKQLAATEALLKVIQKEDPIFAQDLVRTGASQDPRFIQTAARIVDAFNPKQPS
jgi:hypothetical protein